MLFRSLDASITLNHIVSLSGHFAIASLGQRSVTLDNGQQRQMATTLITAQNVEVEFGNSVGTSDFVGVGLHGGRVGLALLKDAQSGLSFLGMSARATTAGIQGVPGVVLTGSNLDVEVNLGPTSGSLAGRVVDFSQGDIDGNGNLDNTPLTLDGSTVATLATKVSEVIVLEIGRAHV